MSYRSKWTDNVPTNVAEKAVLALYLPSALGRVGKRGQPGKADDNYVDFISVYQDTNAYLEDDRVTLRFTDKLIERKERQAWDNIKTTN